MLLILVRCIYLFVCAGVFASYVSSKSGLPTLIEQYPLLAFCILLGVSQIVTIADIVIPRKKLDMISAVYFGLLIGIFLSQLLNRALAPIVGVGSPWEPLTNSMTLIMLPYICISLLMQTKDDFRFVIPYVEFSKEVKGSRPMLLDTSSIIDGRIADLVETKVFDSDLVVPTFILQELQDIADSGDKLRRNRGRRGLDVLNRLRNSPNVEVQLHETDDSKEARAMTVDQRLVSLAKELGGKVITNDFNLNKVASVQGVDVINLNDVSNSLRPRYLPGEHVNIKIIRPGEAHGQGVGYLDDGTMVVCEQGSSLIGKEASVTVTSVLQNSAGRMIFGKLDSHTP